MTSHPNTTTTWTPPPISHEVLVHVLEGAPLPVNPASAVFQACCETCVFSGPTLRTMAEAFADAAAHEADPS